MLGRTFMAHKRLLKQPLLVKLAGYSQRGTIPNDMRVHFRLFSLRLIISFLGFLYEGGLIGSTCSIPLGQR